MSAMPTDPPAQDAQSQQALDTAQLAQQLAHQAQDPALQAPQHQGPGQQAQTPESARKLKAPSVRRACIACHAGKTRCSEVLPCQSCIKRGLVNSCTYPDPDAQDQSAAVQQQQQQQQPGAPVPQATVQFAPPPMYASLGTPTLQHQQYYDYNGSFTGASTSTFRPAKRPRNLTEEEAAAITRNFSRGDFYVGSSAPVRIDPRLPVRLTLGEGDHVHFTVGEALV